MTMYVGLKYIENVDMTMYVGLKYIENVDMTMYVGLKYIENVDNVLIFPQSTIPASLGCIFLDWTFLLFQL